MIIKIDTNIEPRVRTCDALLFIEECSRQDIAIIGMEGGRRINGDFIPDLDLIADLSKGNSLNWVDFRDKCNYGARFYFHEIQPPEETVFVMTVIDEQGFNALYLAGK